MQVHTIIVAMNHVKEGVELLRMLRLFASFAHSTQIYLFVLNPVPSSN